MGVVTFSSNKIFEGVIYPRESPTLEPEPELNLAIL